MPACNEMHLLLQTELEKKRCAVIFLRQHCKRLAFSELFKLTGNCVCAFAFYLNHPFVVTYRVAVCFTWNPAGLTWHLEAHVIMCLFKTQKTNSQIAPSFFSSPPFYCPLDATGWICQILWWWQSKREGAERHSNRYRDVCVPICRVRCRTCCASLLAEEIGYKTMYMLMCGVRLRERLKQFLLNLSEYCQVHAS